MFLDKNRSDEERAPLINRETHTRVTPNYLTEECEVNFQEYPTSSAAIESRIKTFFQKTCRIEVVAFIISVAKGLQGVTQTNLMIDKSCIVDLNFTQEICSNSDNHKYETDLVQQHVTTINLYFTVFSCIPW